MRNFEILVLGLVVGMVCLCPVAKAQVNQGGAVTAPPATGASVGSTSHGSGDRTLVIAPRVAPMPPPPEHVTPPRNAPLPNEKFGVDQSMRGAGLTPPRPYLGISIEPALSRYHRQEIHGLRIVSVDPGSPAERAGLKASTNMTAVGATGKTAGYFLGPVGLLVDPLLARSGQLGRGGDMVVAVDDHRVSSAKELSADLERLKPGDTIWLTVLRIARDGEAHTEKIRVVLAAAADSHEDAAATGASSTQGSASK